MLPKAKGEAVKRLQEAEAYKQAVIDKTKGDAERFNLVYNAYKKGKTITAKRLYLETMEDVGLTLNATGNGYVSIWFEDYDVVEFQEKKMLYSTTRKTREDIPKGYNCYDIKLDSTNTYFDTLEKGETIRHGGTIITKEKIDFGNGTCIDLEEEPILFVGMHEVSFEQFENGEIELKEGMNME